MDQQTLQEKRSFEITDPTSNHLPRQAEDNHEEEMERIMLAVGFRTVTREEHLVRQLSVAQQHWLACCHRSAGAHFIRAIFVLAWAATRRL